MNHINETALGSALRGAGVASPRDRLAEVARKVIARHGMKFELARADFLLAVNADLALCRALFNEKPFADVLQAATLDYLKGFLEVEAKPSVLVREHVRNLPGGAASPASKPSAVPPHVTPSPASTPASTRKREWQPPSKSNININVAVSALEAARRNSKLYTFQVNNKPLAEVTGREAREFAASRVHQATFLNLMVQGVPDDKLVGDCRTAEEADALYERARAETRG